MKLFIPGLLFLTFLSHESSHAQVDFVKENSFYKQLSSIPNNKIIKLKFEDGVKETIKDPVLVESSTILRCPCRAYDLSFKTMEGITKTRQIIFSLNKKESIDYIGSDNIKYEVVNLLDAQGNILAGKQQDSFDRCEYIGTPNFLKIKSNNICKESFICQGRFRNCAGHEEGEVYCLASSDGQCPDAKDCFEDSGIQFSETKGISKRKDQKPDDTNIKVNRQ